MAFPLLPSLNKDSKIALPRRGEWISGAQNTLSGLVDSLKVTADKSSDISSIPDVWARPVLVEAILKDEEHPQHQTYVDEWRGILGIMAMRKIRGFDKVGLQSLNVPDLDKIPSSAPAFLQVIARSLPRDYQEKQNDSTLKPGVQAKIQILTYDDKPLAIIWPSILVCPAVELNSYRANEIPWWGFDGLHDPIANLSDDEENTMYTWLQKIIDTSANDEGLIRLLTAFRDDIKMDLGDAFIDTPLQPQGSGSLGITGLGQCLDQAIVGVIDQDFLKKSHVRLLKQRENKDVPDILLVTTDLDRQWNVNDSEIIVGGYINASTCMHKGSGVILDHTRLGEIDLNEYNAEIHMADEIFTDKIAVFYRDYNALPNVLGNKVYQFGDSSKINVVLPVKKRLLDYLTPEFIAEHTQIKVNGQDITVTLALPVSNEEHPLMTVSKTYKSVQNVDSLSNESDIETYDMLPLIQVWPNVKLRQPNAWQVYYTYFDTGEAMTNFHAMPIYQHPEESIYLPDTAAEITRGTDFPEAFACETVDRSFSGEDEHKEIGLLLLNTNNLQEISTQNSKCKIGIDFGTTNTTAYMKVDGDQPQLIHFKNHKFAVTLTQDAQSIMPEDMISVRQNFISEQEQPSGEQSSIKTMYHANPERLTANPFFSGNIYYIEQSQNIEDDIGILKNIKTNDMKWDQEKGLVSMQGFLMQLCLQCLLEAAETGANTVEWMFSYPKSFSLYQLGQYQSTWTTSIFEVIENASTLKNFAPNSLSESESVAEYFKDNMKASIKRGMLCLDIGGGSTDIAIWQDKGASKNGLINQTSLRFAGRNILNEYIWNRKENGHSIFLKLQNDNKQFTKLLSDLDNETDKKVFDVMLESLLRDYEEDIFRSLPTKNVEPEVKLMIRDITFALAGIFFYCGMLVGYLRKTGKYDTHELLPNCYIGGNASKLLKWSASGKFSSTSLMAQVFKQSLLSGFKLENPDEKVTAGFALNMTDRPKQEVAYGLVTSEPQEAEIFDFGDDEEDNSALLAGEHFAVNEEESDNQIITANDFLSELHIDRQKPENFSDFVDIFNKMMKRLKFEPVKFSDEDFIEICTQVNQDLSDKKDAASGDVDLVEPEPLFVLVLKEAYNYLSMH